MKSPVKMPANPVGLLAVVVVGGIVANMPTAPAAKQVAKVKTMLPGGKA